MSNVDYDKDKYMMDSYGNLIPKEKCNKCPITNALKGIPLRIYPINRKENRIAFLRMQQKSRKGLTQLEASELETLKYWEKYGD